MRDFAHHIKVIMSELLEDKEVFGVILLFYELPTTTWFILFFILGKNYSCVVIREEKI